MTTEKAEPVAWRCFHCGEVFTDAAEAKDHFGYDMYAEPGCKLNAIEGGLLGIVRRQEDQLQAYHREGTARYREFYALGADHSQALRREEEKGYERGLRDGQSLVAPARCDAQSMRAATIEDCAKLCDSYEEWAADKMCEDKSPESTRNQIFATIGNTASDCAEMIRALSGAKPAQGDDVGGQAVIENGALVVRVSLEVLPMVLEGAWTMRKFDTRYKITDGSEFAKEIMHALNREDEQGTTPVHEMFDRVILDAIEHGALGVCEHETQEDGDAAKPAQGDAKQATAAQEHER